MNEINKTIWIYWHQGWENAPKICVECLSSWIRYNPDWRIEKICGDTINNFINLEEVIPGINKKQVSLTALSDIIRIALLKKYGGIWVDSTTLCRKPLNTWAAILTGDDFFAFSKPAPDRLISSWFLFSKKGSYIINTWYKATIAYWEDRSCADEYFWFHYLFNELYEKDNSFKKTWDDAVKISADEPHYFIPYDTNFFLRANKKNLAAMNALQTPVFKLSYKYNQDKNYTNTMLGCLLYGTPEKWSQKVFLTGIIVFIEKLSSKFKRLFAR